MDGVRGTMVVDDSEEGMKRQLAELIGGNGC